MWHNCAPSTGPSLDCDTSVKFWKLRDMPVDGKIHRQQISSSEIFQRKPGSSKKAPPNLCDCIGWCLIQKTRLPFPVPSQLKNLYCTCSSSAPSTLTRCSMCSTISCYLLIDAAFVVTTKEMATWFHWCPTCMRCPHACNRTSIIAA